MTLNSPTRVFAGRFEPLIIGLGLFALVLVFGQYIFGSPEILPSTNLERYTSRYLTDFIFLGSTHVILGYYLLWKIPAFQNSINDKYKSGSSGFLIECILVAVAVTFIYVIGHYSIVVNISNESVIKASQIILLLVTMHHSLAQIFGISNLFSFKIKLNETDARKKNRIQLQMKIERYLFNSFIVFQLSSSLIYIKWDFIVTYIPADILNIMYYSLWTVALISSCLLLVNSMFFLGKQGKRKTLYLSRILIYSFISYSFWAPALILALHGTEYFGIASTIVENSKQNMKYFYKVFAAIFLLTPLIYLARTDYGIVSMFYSDKYSVPPYLMWAEILPHILSYMHFYTDRRLFKMRKPENRKHILPVLLGAN